MVTGGKIPAFDDDDDDEGSNIGLTTILSTRAYSKGFFVLFSFFDDVAGLSYPLLSFPLLYLCPFVRI